MNKYQEGKTRARCKAIEWQIDYFTGERSISWGELAEWQEYFSRLASRFGLVREFRENGII